VTRRYQRGFPCTRQHPSTRPAHQQRHYPGSAAQIRVVRADLRALLAGCLIAHDVILCASELAANATLHSRSGLQGGTFTVRASIDLDHSVQVEVEDKGGPWTSTPTDPTAVTAWTSSERSLPTGASLATTSPAPSGHASTGSTRHSLGERLGSRYRRP
jgi:hypothetical protein